MNCQHQAGGYMIERFSNTFGFRSTLEFTGNPITMDDGYITLIMGMYGHPMIPGAGIPIITGDGIGALFMDGTGYPGKNGPRPGLHGHGMIIIMDGAR